MDMSVGSSDSVDVGHGDLERRGAASCRRTAQLIVKTKMQRRKVFINRAQAKLRELQERRRQLEEIDSPCPSTHRLKDNSDVPGQATPSRVISEPVSESLGRVLLESQSHVLPASPPRGISATPPRARSASTSQVLPVLPASSPRGMSASPPREVSASPPCKVSASTSQVIPASSPRGMSASSPREVSAFPTREVSASTSQVLPASSLRGMSASPTRGMSASSPRGMSASPTRGMSASSPRGMSASPTRGISASIVMRHVVSTESSQVNSPASLSCPNSPIAGRHPTFWRQLEAQTSRSRRSFPGAHSPNQKQKRRAMYHVTNTEGSKPKSRSVPDVSWASPGDASPGPETFKRHAPLRSARRVGIKSRIKELQSEGITRC